MARALRSGRRGRKFKSCFPEWSMTTENMRYVCLLSAAPVGRLVFRALVAVQMKDSCPDSSLAALL